MGYVHTLCGTFVLLATPHTTRTHLYVRPHHGQRSFVCYGARNTNTSHANVSIQSTEYVVLFFARLLYINAIRIKESNHWIYLKAFTTLQQTTTWAIQPMAGDNRIPAQKLHLPNRCVFSCFALYGAAHQRVRIAPKTFWAHCRRVRAAVDSIR